MTTSPGHPGHRSYRQRRYHFPHLQAELNHGYRGWLRANSIDPDTGKMTEQGVAFFKTLIEEQNAVNRAKRSNRILAPPKVDTHHHPSPTMATKGQRPDYVVGLVREGGEGNVITARP